VAASPAATGSGLLQFLHHESPARAIAPGLSDEVSTPALNQINLL